MTKAAVHILVAADNGQCISQARFTPHDGKVHVLALLGCTRYIDREYSIEEARCEYRNLLDAGWVKPAATPILTERQLKLHIYN